MLKNYELEQHERELLLQTCQTADVITELQAAVDKLGVDCAHRELAEIRQQRLAYARLLVALRLPPASTTSPSSARSAGASGASMAPVSVAWREAQV